MFYAHLVVLYDFNRRALCYRRFVWQCYVVSMKLLDQPQTKSVISNNSNNNNHMSDILNWSVSCLSIDDDRGTLN